MQKAYLESIKQQFEFYKELGERSFDQLNEEELFWEPGENCNSIATIINHLAGNMRSRWTDFLTSDGEKAWRNRDREFDPPEETKADLMAKWEMGWACVFQALETVNEDNFKTTIYIRNQAHSVIEAMHRQLGHYSYHLGQIVLLAKIIRGFDWQTLSIARGKSREFNEEKFSQPRD